MEVRSPSRTLRLACVLAIAIAHCSISGCASPVYLRKRLFPVDPAEERLANRCGRLSVGDKTRRYLWHIGMSGPAFVNPKFVCRVTKASSHPLSAEGTYALAELSYIAAHRAVADDTEMELFLDAATYAWEYLFEARHSDGAEFSSRFREMCDVYNSGLEGCLRIARKRDQFDPGRTIRMPITGREISLTASIDNSQWCAKDFQRIEFVSDYDAMRLDNHHAETGLGVPLVVVRENGSRDDGTEGHLVRGLSFPMTALYRPDGAGNGRLRFYDTLNADRIRVDGKEVPLTSDLTIPLAWFLNDNHLRYLDTVGLIFPDRVERVAGLYMLQPYQPGKIPVLMVHGLWSSPTTWMEMINELISKPEIRARYQFWFYLYPSARPFWVAAADLRKDLAELRQAVDPHHRETQLDNMVVIGHSMGGLIGRLLTTDSSDEFRQGMMRTLNCPLGDRKWKEANFDRVADFQADRSIRRVVTIASPHRGSSYANRLTRWIARTVISTPARAVELMMCAGNIAKSEPKPIDNPLGLTSIDSLSPSSPVLQTLARAPRAPWVTYHNIVGLKPNLLRLKTDGVVSYSSARVPDAASEIAVPSAHSHVHRHALTIREVYRILKEHLRGPVCTRCNQPVLPAASENSSFATGL